MKYQTKEELLQYAQKLENSTISKTIAKAKSNGEEIYGFQDVDYNYNGKGKFGQFLEEAYFGKKNDSASRPDFDNLGIELKVSPLKEKETNEGIQRVVKERLVLNHINFCDIVKESFESSHFLEKNAHLLLVFYLFNPNIDLKDREIDLVDIWETLKHDKDQIQADWELIVNKIKDGKAHEISEGDTLYLGACTKGQTAETSWQVQPFNPAQKAKGRAFCFKLNYINTIFKILKDKQAKRPIVPEQRLNPVGQYQTIENRVESLVKPFKGLSGAEIYKHFHATINFNYKSRYAYIAQKMIIPEGKDYYEFKAGGIQIKSIRIEDNGIIKESMSFTNIYYCDIVNEEWEDSTFYSELTSRFIFMIFKAIPNTKDYYFADALVWNMPEEDLDKAQIVWEKTKSKILIGDYDNFPKAKENRKSTQETVAHVRPKGRDSLDLMITSQGTMEKKKCFWLNNSYITSVLKKAKPELFR